MTKEEFIKLCLLWQDTLAYFVHYMEQKALYKRYERETVLSFTEKQQKLIASHLHENISYNFQEIENELKELDYDLTQKVSLPFDEDIDMIEHCVHYIHKRLIRRAEKDNLPLVYKSEKHIFFLDHSEKHSFTKQESFKQIHKRFLTIAGVILYAISSPLSPSDPTNERLYSQFGNTPNIILSDDFDEPLSDFSDYQ